MIKVDTTCPFCWGRGEVTRENRGTGKMFAWPCIELCVPPGRSFIKTKIPSAKKLKKPS